MKYHRLGELQVSFRTFEQSLIELQAYLSGNFYSQKKALLQKSLTREKAADSPGPGRTSKPGAADPERGGSAGQIKGTAGTGPTDAGIPDYFYAATQHDKLRESWAAR